MPMVDSIDKVVQVYMACITAEPFDYKGKVYDPKPLQVSPLIFRGFTCPPGWAMLRVDGERGALCEMTPADAHTKAEVLRKLQRLQEWSRHFGVSTKLAKIIRWVEGGPQDDPLIV